MSTRLEFVCNRCFKGIIRIVGDNEIALRPLCCGHPMTCNEDAPPNGNAERCVCAAGACPHHAAPSDHRYKWHGK